MASSHEVTSCWTGGNAPWKQDTHSKVIGLFGNGDPLFARCLFVWPSLLWQEKTQYGDFIWNILSYQGIFHLVYTALRKQRQGIQLLPVWPTHLPDSPDGFQEIPVFPSRDIPGCMGCLVNWGWHVSQALFHLLHLSFLGISSLFISALLWRRKFSLLRTTSAQYLSFSNGKHCWDS